ncbi:MAG: hypothetical protein QW518_08175, partial [Thermofilaceae archaeon]
MARKCYVPRLVLISPFIGFPRGALPSASRASRLLRGMAGEGVMGAAAALGGSLLAPFSAPSPVRLPAALPLVARAGPLERP